MRKSFSSRRCAILLPLGLLMLSCAVFGWGLQYKLSLYQAKDSVSHSAPQAKLLSQKERFATALPAGAPSVHAAAQAIAGHTFLLALLPNSNTRATQYQLAALADKVGPPRPPCIAALFLRPPPVAVPSQL